MPDKSPFLEERIQKTIALIYAGIADPAAFPRAFEAIAALVGAKGMMIGPLTPGVDPRPGLVAYASEAFHEAIPEYLTHFLAINPRKNWLTRNNISDAVFSDFDFATARDFKSHAFYNDFLLKYDNFYSLDRISSQISVDSKLWISAQYSASCSAPDSDARELFGILSGHVAQAIGISRSIYSGRLPATSGDELVHHYECPALLLDASGRIVQMNAHAARLDGKGLTFRDCRVATTTSRDAQAFAQMLRAALTADHRQHINIMRTTPTPDGEMLLLRATALRSGPGGSPFLESLFGARRILLIAEPTASLRGRNVVGPLRVLGLTPAEAHVAALIGGGLTPEEAATECAIAVSTVRLHVRHIYGKLGLRRQAELSRLVARLEKFANGA